MKNWWLLIVGIVLILLSLSLLYFLVEGFQVGSLTLKSSRVQLQDNPAVFWVLAVIYAFASVGCLAIGALLAKEGFANLTKGQRD